MEVRKLKRLSAVQAAYIAGLIDGEGTITLTVKQKGAQRQLVVSISNTEYELLEHLKNMIGAGKVTSKKKVTDGHKKGYTYVLSNRLALELLKFTFQYLASYKKNRAQLVLDYYIALTPRNGKYTKELYKKREEFIKTFFGIKFSLRKQNINLPATQN